MKKFVLAAAVLALSGGAAFAENPYVGQPSVITAQNKAFAQPGNSAVVRGNVDYTAPASIGRGQQVYRDGSAHRFGDADPGSYQN